MFIPDLRYILFLSSLEVDYSLWFSLATGWQGMKQRCVCTGHSCPLPFCENHCPFGHRKDKNKCITCECQEDPCLVRVSVQTYRNKLCFCFPMLFNSWGQVLLKYIVFLACMCCRKGSVRLANLVCWGRVRWVWALRTQNVKVGQRSEKDLSPNCTQCARRGDVNSAFINSSIQFPTDLGPVPCANFSTCNKRCVFGFKKNPDPKKKCFVCECAADPCQVVKEWRAWTKNHWQAKNEHSSFDIVLSKERTKNILYILVTVWLFRVLTAGKKPSMLFCGCVKLAGPCEQPVIC